MLRSPLSVCPVEQALLGGADQPTCGVCLLELEAHKVASERLGIELRYRGPYIHVGDRLTKLLYSTNPVACVYLHYACDTPVTRSAGSM